jgi:hypothetical protein
MTLFFKRNINDIETAVQNGAFAHERLVVCISSTKERADIIELHDNKRDTLFYYDNPDFTQSAALTQMLSDIITKFYLKKIPPCENIKNIIDFLSFFKKKQLSLPKLKRQINGTRS